MLSKIQEYLGDHADDLLSYKAKVDSSDPVLTPVTILKFGRVPAADHPHSSPAP